MMMIAMHYGMSCGNKKQATQSKKRCDQKAMSLKVGDVIPNRSEGPVRNLLFLTTHWQLQ